MEGGVYCRAAFIRGRAFLERAAFNGGRRLLEGGVYWRAAFNGWRRLMEERRLLEGGV